MYSLRVYSWIQKVECMVGYSEVYSGVQGFTECGSIVEYRGWGVYGGWVYHVSCTDWRERGATRDVQSFVNNSSVNATQCVSEHHVQHLYSCRGGPNIHMAQGYWYITSARVLTQPWKYTRATATNPPDWLWGHRVITDSIICPGVSIADPFGSRLCLKGILKLLKNKMTMYAVFSMTMLSIFNCLKTVINMYIFH